MTGVKVRHWVGRAVAGSADSQTGNPCGGTYSNGGVTTHDLRKLAALLRDQRETLLSHWREQVRLLPSSRKLDKPALDDHVPALLDELAAAFHSVADETIPETLRQGSSPMHGLDRFQNGFDLQEVVAEYNILRGCVYDMAERHNLELQGRAFHILNRVLDEAIGLAVQAFATQQALEVQRRREDHLRFVAHDFRTPLQTVALSARVLEQKLRITDNTGQTAEIFQILQRNVQHLESLVEEVLKESDHTAGSGLPCDARQIELWPVVDAVIDEMRPVADTAGTRLTNDVPEAMTACADMGMLKRVLQNLIANAIKHTPRGEVSVGARSLGSSGAIECQVRDDGAGIPADQLARIFDTEPNSAERRTGVGLSIVKTFVEAHGGTAHAESLKGSGSTFRFTLPASTLRQG